MQQKLSLFAFLDLRGAPVTGRHRIPTDLFEIVEDRYERAATLIATQLPVNTWHDAIGEPTLADAICDRLIHRAYRIELKGRSMRETRAPELQAQKSPRAKKDGKKT